MTHLGIDGCRGGWIVAEIDEFGKLDHHLISSLDKISVLSPKLALIDIPLDFANESYRSCEIDAQLLLGSKKRASIFLTPQKNTVFATNYYEANRLNKLTLGKGLSKQSWNIFNKIKEAYQFINCQPDFPLYEAHPELCFYLLNGFKPLFSKKSQSDGANDRLKIISDYDSKYLQAIKNTMLRTKRSAVKLDDVIDATILAIRARSKNIQTVPAHLNVGDRDAILF